MTSLRARLEAVLQKHLKAAPAHGSGFVSAIDDYQVCLTDLLACWTPPSGETTLTWCQHCCYETGIPAIKAEGWWLHSGQQALVNIPSSWKCCPVCAAPRPSEPS